MSDDAVKPSDVIAWLEKQGGSEEDDARHAWPAYALASFAAERALLRSYAECIRSLVARVAELEAREARLACAIEVWWRSHRPLRWTEETHAENRYVSQTRTSGGPLCDIAAEAVLARRALTELTNTQETSEAQP